MDRGVNEGFIRLDELLKKLMFKTLHFNIQINAPKEKVWNTMLDLDTFKVWTSEFMSKLRS